MQRTVPAGRAADAAADDALQGVEPPHLLGGFDSAVAKNSLKECEDQLLRLARSQVPTSKLAAHAGRIALGFWAELRATQRSELRYWLDVQHADAQQLIATSRLNAGVRKAEVMMGAMDAIKKIAPPEQG